MKWSNIKTEPLDGWYLKVLDIIHSLQKPRQLLGFFKQLTTQLPFRFKLQAVENFEIFSGNALSIISIQCSFFNFEYDIFHM